MFNPSKIFERVQSRLDKFPTREAWDKYEEDKQKEIINFFAKNGFNLDFPELQTCLNLFGRNTVRLPLPEFEKLINLVKELKKNS